MKFHLSFNSVIDYIFGVIDALLYDSGHLFVSCQIVSAGNILSTIKVYSSNCQSCHVN